MVVKKLNHSRSVPPNMYPSTLISKIFDPLGLISPTTVQAKLSLQRLWQTQASWDEVIPLELQSLWKQFYKSMENLNDMEIPRKVIGQALLTYESLYTVLTQIEAVLNSRPFLPQECSFLTPSHFLIGDTPMNVSESEVREIPTNRLKVYEHLQKITQHLWKRWSFEYLTSLQLSKWAKSHPNLVIGDLVIIKDDNLPKMCWNVGRITSLHPGDDGDCRVVTVRSRSFQLESHACTLIDCTFADKKLLIIKSSGIIAASAYNCSSQDSNERSYGDDAKIKDARSSSLILSPHKRTLAHLNPCTAVPHENCQAHCVFHTRAT
ncbi:hypothetical protein Trydic_g10816 [Trypoxylus dichotomus]